VVNKNFAFFSSFSDLYAKAFSVLSKEMVGMLTRVIIANIGCYGLNKKFWLFSYVNYST
jgi:hypothetical protein